MTISPAPPIEQRLAAMAAAIHELIPAAEVRLFGSRAHGQARPDSDVDLLITAPDAWLARWLAVPPMGAVVALPPPARSANGQRPLPVVAYAIATQPLCPAERWQAGSWRRLGAG